MDPLEFRLKNLETKATRSPTCLTPATARGGVCARRRLFQWKERWKGWKKGARDLTQPQRGIGLAPFRCNKGGASPPMTAIVQIRCDGSVIVDTGAADIGAGQRTTWIMIVAEAIGVPMDRSIHAMDNQAGPDSLGIFAVRAAPSPLAPACSTRRSTPSASCSRRHVPLNRRADRLERRPAQRRTSSTSSDGKSSSRRPRQTRASR